MTEHIDFAVQYAGRKAKLVYNGLEVIILGYSLDNDNPYVLVELVDTKQEGHDAGYYPNFKILHNRTRLSDGLWSALPEDLDIIAEVKPKNPLYPRECPACHNPAYIGFNKIDCSLVSCVYGDGAARP